MNNIFDIINVPLGLLMNMLYSFCNNYALTLLLFAIVAKIILLPLGIQQQKSQIKMAKIRPKEQAIRKKYAGRTDTATQQKMQSEIMAMYKTENHSVMGGCLPMLVQLPIIFALFNIIRNPLTYISRFSAELVDAIKIAIFNLKDVAGFDDVTTMLARFNDEKSAVSGLQQIDIIAVFDNHLSVIKEAVLSAGGGIADLDKFAEYINIDFGFFGQNLIKSPSEAGLLSILMLIPLLNFAGQFLQTRIQRKITAKTMAAEAGKSMKIMEYFGPLMILWFSYSMNAAVGLYWVFQCIFSIVQSLVLAKLYPIPEISEEEYRLAEQQYGSASVKKKKKKPPVNSESSESDDINDEVIETRLLEDSKENEKDNDENDENDDNNNESGENGGDKKYMSKTIPQGKTNYQKTGKKYSIKRRKK